MLPSTSEYRSSLCQGCQSQNNKNTPKNNTNNNVEADPKNQQEQVVFVSPVQQLDTKCQVSFAFILWEYPFYVCLLYIFPKNDFSTDCTALLG